MDVVQAAGSSIRHEGVVYTPAPVVRHILRHTLDELLAGWEGNSLPLRILDPACGDGAFLVEACGRLLDRRQPADATGRLAIVRTCVFGVDVDSCAVGVARKRLAAAALGYEETGGLLPAQREELDRATASLTENLVCGDALAERRPVAFLQPGAFQAIVANPPFVGARRMARRQGGSWKSEYRRYACLQGSCDLYVAFLERIVDLLAEGGKFGVVAPNRIAQSDYARRCRELLLTQTRLERIDDVSALDVFPSAAVYPWILCGTKATAAPAHHIEVSRPASLSELGHSPTWRVRQHAGTAARGLSLHVDLDLESRVPTQPLASLATLHSGTTGFAAQRMADALVERSEFAGEAWDFITTGNIDRYQVRLGDVRFLRRDYRRPVLPSATPFLSERKRRLYEAPKIVLAGMCRHPEAAWSSGGLALGVQVYAAAEFREDPLYLLALLNSKLFAFLFGTRYHSRRMAGGYIAINKGQLVTLPIRRIDHHDARERRLRGELADAAERLTRLKESRAAEALSGEFQTLERQIDDAVFELYAVTESETVRMEVEIQR